MDVDYFGLVATIYPPVIHHILTTSTANGDIIDLSYNGAFGVDHVLAMVLLLETLYVGFFELQVIHHDNHN